MNLLSNIISASPVILYSSSIFGYILTSHEKSFSQNTFNVNIFLLFIFGFAIFYTLSNPILKKLSKRLFESSWLDGISKRPNPPMIGCGLFPDLEMKGSTTYGFPSGHAQAWGFFSMFWSLFLVYIQSISTCTSYTYPKILFLWFCFFMVCMQRIYTGCHNLFQVLGGGTIGAIFSILYYSQI
jgi:membrane-associated phospholipid phosphatase